MRRRQFITLLGGAAVWPLAARAQQPRHIGVLTPFNERDPEVRSRVSAFQEALREAGWGEGRNIVVLGETHLRRVLKSYACVYRELHPY